MITTYRDIADDENEAALTLKATITLMSATVFPRQPVIDFLTATPTPVSVVGARSFLWLTVDPYNNDTVNALMWALRKQFPDGFDISGWSGAGRMSL